MDTSGDRSVDSSNDCHVLLRRVSPHILRSTCLILSTNRRSIKLLLPLYVVFADDLHLPCFRSSLQHGSRSNLSDIPFRKKMRSEQYIRLLRWRSLHIFHPLPQCHHQHSLVSYVPMIILIASLYDFISVDRITNNFLSRYR